MKVLDEKGKIKLKWELFYTIKSQLDLFLGLAAIKNVLEVDLGVDLEDFIRDQAVEFSDSQDLTDAAMEKVLHRLLKFADEATE